MFKAVKIICTITLCLLYSTQVFSADFAYKSNIEPTDITSQLLKFYTEKFKPESLELIIEDKPDETGLFKNIYMDIAGCNISGVRIDRLTFQLMDAQFNNPVEWVSKEPECLSVLEAYVNCRLLEADINADLEKRVIGDRDDNWRKLKLKISPKGLSGSGEYNVKLLITFNVLIEIESNLRIVGGREVWLKDTFLKLNRLDVPEHITNMALDQIQPVLDLKPLPMPLKLNRITFKDKEAIFETRVLPSRIKGICYSYVK